MHLSPRYGGDRHEDGWGEDTATNIPVDPEEPDSPVRSEQGTHQASMKPLGRTKRHQSPAPRFSPAFIFNVSAEPIKLEGAQPRKQESQDGLMNEWVTNIPVMTIRGISIMSSSPGQMEETAEQDIGLLLDIPDMPVQVEGSINSDPVESYIDNDPYN